MRTQQAYIETTNLALAHKLLTLGIPFNNECPYVKIRSEKGEQFKFFFEESSICGNFGTLAIMKAWGDDSFAIDNPEHPFAYLKCDHHNRNGLLDLVKQPGNEMITIQKNGKIAVISKNASPELQQKIFSQLWDYEENTRTKTSKSD